MYGITPQYHVPTVTKLPDRGYGLAIVLFPSGLYATTLPLTADPPLQ